MDRLGEGDRRMTVKTGRRWFGLTHLVVVLALGRVGCHHPGSCRSCGDPKVPVVEAPKELNKVTYPPYMIETPDVLLIDVLRVVPLPPYHISALDVLFIQVTNTLPGEPISGQYTVEPEGIVNLGPSYGTVTVIDMTLDQSKAAIEEHLRRILRMPQVSVVLAQSRGVQLVRGEHLVRPDGTVSLGLYGAVYVVGLTLEQAKAAIEQHLSKYLLRPEVAVDVAGYNSKVYYIITDGAGFGEQVVRVPATGNETVLDAMTQIAGLSAVSSRKRIWVARPAPAGNCPDQILPVDWNGIVRGGETATNYQILPGDRIYLMAEPVVTLNTYLNRVIAPIERVFGFILFGTETVRVLQNRSGGGTGGGTGTGTGTGL